MATTLRSRIERLERELQFRAWVRHQRFLKSLSFEELGQLATTGQIPNRPQPLPGTSPLDNMTREELHKLWEENKRVFFGRNSKELDFYAVHGHWPEQGCANRDCRATSSDGGTA